MGTGCASKMLPEQRCRAALLKKLLPLSLTGSGGLWQEATTTADSASLCGDPGLCAASSQRAGDLRGQLCTDAEGLRHVQGHREQPPSQDARFLPKRTLDPPAKSDLWRSLRKAAFGGPAFSHREALCWGEGPEVAGPVCPLSHGRTWRH